MTLEFTLEPQDVVAVRGKPLVLQCAVSSSAPGPVNISWTHDGEVLPLVSDSRRHLLSNGSLYFKKVSLVFGSARFKLNLTEAPQLHLKFIPSFVKFCKRLTMNYEVIRVE